MKLFLDSNTLIYYFEGSAAMHAHMAAYFTQLRQQYPTGSFCISRLCIMECSIKPLREKNKYLLDKYNAFFKTVEITELTQTVLEKATQIRAHYGLKTPDALHAASALSMGVETLFITGDAGFNRVPSLNMNLVSLPVFHYEL